MESRYRLMMKRRINVLLLVVITIGLLGFNYLQRSFKEDQKRYPRVRAAYAEKAAKIEIELAKAGLRKDNVELLLRVFKFEKELELWGKKRGSDQFKRIKTFPICNTSGELGPKRKQGDFQIPEGFYYIDRFNPSSSFHLSLGINYPNPSDRVLGNKADLGGDIFIHGACATIGCVPITDDLIKELYVYCVEAKNNGQSKIPVTIFPVRMNDDKYSVIKREYADKSDVLNLWKALKKEYDLFEISGSLPNIRFLENGEHEVIQLD